MADALPADIGPLTGGRATAIVGSPAVYSPRLAAMARDLHHSGWQRSGLTMSRRVVDRAPSREDRHSAVRRATYYLRPDQIRGLKVCAAARGRYLSDLMRDAVDRYLNVCAPGVLRRLGRRWVPRARL